MNNSKFNNDGYYYARTKEEFPTEPHYAVMEFSTIYIPGDARSESCPGHGYPSENRDTRNYIVFNSKESWETYVKIVRLHQRSTIFVAMYVVPAVIRDHVTVEVQVKP